MNNCLYVVYGIRLYNSDNYRYVGMTVRGIDPRRYGHFYSAYTLKSHLPVHCWMRKYQKELIIVEPLEYVYSLDLKDLENCEIKWIQKLKEDGNNLLNITEGGSGVTGLVGWRTGIPLTEKEKENLRLKNTGKKHSQTSKDKIRSGVKEHFKNNQQKSVYEYWLAKFGKETADRLQEEKRDKASKALSGSGNPMYGKSGQDAPCYGRVGEKHPMYGKTHTEEAKAKISASLKGKPLPPETKLKMGYAQHIRFHENKVNTKCRWCLGDNLNDEIEKITNGKNDNMGRTI